MRRYHRGGRRRTGGFALIYLLPGLLPLAASCSPVVRVEAPSQPITINLNIKLDADLRLRVEEKAKDDVKTQPIF